LLVRYNNICLGKSTLPCIVEGLTAAADYIGDGIITVNILDPYFSERVKKLTEGQQTPTTTKPETIQ